MAKQKVTLSLDTEIYERTREMLRKTPGSPSVSSLVDQLLDQFTLTMGPALAALGSGYSLEAASQQFLESASAQFVRILDEEDDEPEQAKK